MIKKLLFASVVLAGASLFAGASNAEAATYKAYFGPGGVHVGVRHGHVHIGRVPYRLPHRVYYPGYVPYPVRAYPVYPYPYLYPHRIYPY